MRARSIGWLLLGALLVFAAPAFAQANRLNAIWARQTTAPITLDGVLGEPAWAQAESVLVRYGKDNGIPGSGYKEEGGRLAKDSTYAILKFLRNGNQLYLAVTVRDSSVGGSDLFNRFDGFLMAVKDHRDPNGLTHLPIEHLYSWWHPENLALNAVDGSPGFRGEFGAQDTVARTPAQIAAWDAFTKVRGGHSNADTTLGVPIVATNDSGYTVEMRWDVTATGYDFTQPNGDVFEWNISIYDCDWFWPVNIYRFSSNRTWWESPWGNDYWFDEVRVFGRDDVTTSSGALPAYGNEYTFKSLGTTAPPVIDGQLSEAVWANAPYIDIQYDDLAARSNYTGVMRWRAGQYQPNVLGSQALVVDPGFARVRSFFKDDTLYFGFDVNDAVVQNYSIEDRWDGFRVSIQDRGVRSTTDRNLESRPLTFIVSPTGTAQAMEYLPFLRDTVGGARVALQLKPGTTVDTLGTDIDAGYTAELAVDLTKLGYPHGLGDGTIWFGVSMYDGDSFTPFTDSYGTRAWFAREREHRCCPANAYADPTQFVNVGVDGGSVIPARAMLLGAAPNPFRQVTQLRYALPRASRVALEVFDIQGRVVASRPLGVQSAGAQATTFARGALGPGLYLYRFRITDPVNGTDQGTLNGKLMILK
jgi:hypothetical protein